MLCLGLGIAFLFVPGMPTTIFLILALAFFRRGSARMEHWLLNHRRFGPAMRRWDETGGITSKGKTIAMCGMWVSVLASAFFLPSAAAKASVLALGLLASWYILSRPTIEP